jgi:small-conductance mechanosensitive channel
MTTLGRSETWIPLAALAAGLLAVPLLRLAARRCAPWRGRPVAEALAARTTRPLLLVLPIASSRLAQSLLGTEPAVGPVLRQAGTLLLTVGFGWLLMALIGVLDQSLRERVLSRVDDGPRARRLATRVAILRRALNTAIIVLTAAGVLVTFPEGRAVGASILASAGIAGIVLGVAARPAAENLIAGLQVAFTEPFHINDVVVVEGEWGTIEEIAVTYVIVCIWDQRRLVVPLRQFIEKPFQNWTRSGAELLAHLTLEVDYTTPVDELRRHAGEVVAASEHWDRRSWNLQVTGAGDRTMRLRIVATARDAARAWDLRCEVRERMIAYLQERHPGALPRLRASFGEPAPRDLE